MSKTKQTQSLDQRLEALKTMIIELEEDNSLNALKTLLEEGVDPKTLLSCCMEGMHHVGIRFEKGVYFISALIMAGEIMRSATELLSPYLSVQQTSDGGGNVLLGTIQGDIHDLGKNLFALLLKCHGIGIIDLGVDIPGQTFLDKALEFKPDIIGISCVLTTSVDALKEAVTLLNRKLPHPQIPVIIGGTCIDERVAAYVGAPHWTADAAVGLKLVKSILDSREI